MKTRYSPASIVEEPFVSFQTGRNITKYFVVFANGDYIEAGNKYLARAIVKGMELLEKDWKED